MRHLSLAAAILIAFCLVFLIPGPAAGEWPTQAGLGLHLSQNEESGLTFARKYDPEGGNKKEDQNALSSSMGRPGYWFEDCPWLGLASESSVLQPFAENEQSLESSIDADTDFDLLSSFILFRCRNWQFEPFMGIGPTLIISEFGSEKPNSANNMFLGFFYIF
jgi:hypothetical protein